MHFNRLTLVRARYIISIFVVIAVLMVATAIYEFYENKREIYHLLDDYANSVVYLIDKSSANTVVSDQELENLLSQHLLGVARNVKRIDSISTISNSLLKSVAEENDVYRINIFDKNTERLYSNYTPDSLHTGIKGKYSLRDYLNPILNGEENEIIIGFKEARFEKGSRYAVAVKRALNRNGVIVVNLDAETFLEFRKQIGFGKMIQDIGSKSSIDYVVLQSPKEIIAANKKVDDISSFDNDSFIKDSYNKNITQTRVNNFQDRKIFEVVKPFIVDNEKIGIFRVALSMDEVNSAEARMYRRGIITSLILIIISVIVIGIIVSNQNYKMVSEEYRKIQTFTGNILDNMSQAVITTDLKGFIKIFNKTAEKLFNIQAENAIGADAGKICEKCNISLMKIFENSDEIDRLEMKVEHNSDKRIFEINKTINFDSNKLPEFITVVISDNTELKNIERQAIQNEKLIAMGELASAVAHEVRNPLNTINMIAQRLNKEYSGGLKSDDFNNLNSILQSESKRINGIIEEFLRFARPPKLHLTRIESDIFLNEIKTLFDIQTKEKGVEFLLNAKEKINLHIDTSQMKQALMNLLTNALDATSMDGIIELSVFRNQNKVIFEIRDNGSGIKKENLDKIFNLYFTTKTKGTGLGLSIVQQIISQHNGTIFVDSSEGKSTKFTIEIPN